MLEFTPGEAKTARAPITAKPAGLSCSTELYLVSNSTKVATSGLIPFTSTGVSQDISFPVTMPKIEGTYPVFIEVYAEDTLIATYRAVEDVVIAAVGIVGDLNDDGIISMADYDILQLYILGRPISEISPLPEAEFLRRADVNGDGAINVLDLTALVKMLPQATLTQVELEYDGVQATIPLADVPQGKTARMHIWGRNDMSTDQKLGIAWVIDDPDIEMAQVYSEWEPEYTSPGEEHEFIGPEFNLGKLGDYTIAVASLYIYPEGTWPVDTIPPAPTICTVVIAPAVPPATILAGAIIDTKWRETGTEEWHPWPMSIPGNTGIDVLWRVRNNSDGRATFAVSTGTPERFFTIHSDNVVTLDPGGEADLIHEGYSGEKAGTSGTQTWDLIALAGEVTSSDVRDWLEAVFVDSVTLEYSWY